MARIDPVYHVGMPAKIGDVVLNQIVKVPSHQPDSVSTSALCVKWFMHVILTKFAIDRIGRDQSIVLVATMKFCALFFTSTFFTHEFIVLFTDTASAIGLACMIWIDKFSSPWPVPFGI